MIISSRDFPVMLVILDGFGYTNQLMGNAVAAASMPTLDYLISHYPHTILHASGESVGLPAGAPGNSEVGHLTIGAGRAVLGLLTQINNDCADKKFCSKIKLQTFLQNCVNERKRLHMIGLLSPGGVHSHEKHLYELINCANQAGLTPHLHLFTDGRDTAPKSASSSLEQLELFLHNQTKGKIASLQGRFYAMDRDKNWERTAASFSMLTGSPLKNYEKNSFYPKDFFKKITTQKSTSWRTYIAHCYHEKITDEFIPPQLLLPEGLIAQDDAVIFFNFRADRARQLTELFMEQEKIQLLTMAPYFDEAEKNNKLTFLYDAVSAPTTFFEEIEKQAPGHYSFFTIAETEKYTHVTRFLHGANRTKSPGESQLLIPSIKTKNYVQEPQMSAYKITQALIEQLRTKQLGQTIYTVNYANADMVGHSGNFLATVTACEFLDEQLRLLYHECVEKRGGIMIITADHGNAETMLYPNKTVHTSHTNNKVPVIIAHQKLQGAMISDDNNRSLADIAPTILTLLGLKVPSAMTGKSLV